MLCFLLIPLLEFSLPEALISPALFYFYFLLFANTESSTELRSSVAGPMLSSFSFTSSSNTIQVVAVGNLIPPEN